MASSSQSQIAFASPPLSNKCWKYGVFLSFRGADTRKGITFDIYNRLNSRGIKTFMDEQGLQVGDVITPSLLAAIKQSRFAIVVLSQNYASSVWCLEELQEICLSMEDNRILPLFYHVNPSDVRYQKRSFEEAFSNHETSKRHESEKVIQWKATLNKVANISGWNTTDYKTHKELVDVIVEFIHSKVVPDAIEYSGDFEAYEATRRGMDEVMKALKDEKVTAISVYGMGGVGKTTLVKHVGAQACRNGIFRRVIMVVVSQNPDIEKLQNTLAEKLGFNWEKEEKTGEKRITRLNGEMMETEKLLIILDDVWERIELSKIGVFSYEELQKRKSKVLLTTRIRNVCHVMNCQEIITLNILSREDSWTLFLRMARMSFESTAFEDVAREVAGECEGLPIALITVARALGDKDFVEWKRAAQRLKKSQISNPDDNGAASKCIKLSYDFLKDEEYKAYFLLCCLYPKDFDIPIEDLFRYSIGRGLFRDAETLEEARGSADSVARHLKYSSLLLDGRNNKFVKMHDVVRDTALQIAQSEHGFLVKAGCRLWDWPRKLYEGCSTISLMRNHFSKLPEKLVCPKLQILLLNSIYFMEEIPETFFESLNELRVLDLSWVGFSLLPQSLSLLTNLEGLYLDGCHITDTSILGKLKKLEIVSMRNSRLTEFSREIGGLTNLRMLDNTGGDIARIPSKVISKLHSLEELYMQGYVNWGSVVEGEGEETVAGFDEVTSLSNLRVLKVCVSDADCLPEYGEFKSNLVEFDIRIGKYEPCKVMKDFDRFDHNKIYLKLDIISRLPYWFCNKIMKIAESLFWKGSQRLTDIFVESEHGRLQGLKHLFILGTVRNVVLRKFYEFYDIPEGGPTRNKVMNTITWVPKKPVFENLEELYLDGLDCTELCVLEFLPPGSLFNLKVLKARLCYNWGRGNTLLPSTLLQRLLNLEELHCHFINGIKYVFGYEEALLVSEPLKLRKIELSCLPAVRSLCKGSAPPAMFQNLQSLSITDCKLHESLFSYDVAQCLSQLNYFLLEECPYLKRIVEASNKKIILPKLEKLILSRLPMLNYESATFDIECPSLEYLYMWDCPESSVSSFDFHSRKQVKLRRWTED